jgi:DNA-directed RNA polymerase subunit RPC12/RpoP
MAPGDQDAEASADTEATTPPSVTERDIVFNCAHCQGELVVDREGEGLEVQCPHCGYTLVIPAYHPKTDQHPDQTATAGPLANIERFDFRGFSADQLGRRVEELRHQLKENRSQDTELRGHVGRATMELHRLQLRLQKLRDRQLEIEAEISAAQRHTSEAQRK